MRGRVGRSNKKAFCYLFAPPVTHMTPEARQRLQAIEQFSGLGSGFNIAMRDLDIRGAGNLLGAEQSGFISDIGFDMYHKILNEAIEELKETEFKGLYKDDKEVVFVKECQIDTDMEILFPDTYVNSISERLALYKELDDTDNEEALNQFRINVIDRFGPLPEPAEELLDTIRLRWIAKEIGFEKIIMKSMRMVGYFVADESSPFYQSDKFMNALKYVQQNPGKCTMKQVKEKLTLRFENVTSIQKAIDCLEPIAAKEVEVSE